MGDSSNWSMDRLAANNLLASLKLEITDDNLGKVTGHFARHRQSSIGWAAERARSAILRKLESALMSRSGHEDDAWRNGFCFAEQQVLTAMPHELLELSEEKVRTKGQVLRALVRQARTR